MRKYGIVCVLTACLCVGLASCAARRAGASDQRLTETSCPDDRRDTLLTTDDLRTMTGEEIRISFCRGEIFVKDIFLLSDTAYIAAQLDELFRHYEHPDENFRYPDFESAPDGVDFGDSFTLDNCEIISRDTRAVSPIMLKAIPHNSKCVDAPADFSSDDTKIRRQGTAPVKDFCEV